MQVKILSKGHVILEVSTLISKSISCWPNLWESSQTQENNRLEPLECRFPRDSLTTTVVSCWPKLQSSVYTQSKGYNKQHREKEISSKFLFCLISIADLRHGKMQAKIGWPLKRVTIWDTTKEAAKGKFVQPQNKWWGLAFGNGSTSLVPIKSNICRNYKYYILQ